jgi:hypothetical protein
MLILRGQSGNNTLRETADHLFGKTYLIIIFLTLLSIIILIIGNQVQMPALDVAIAIVAIGDVVSLKNISMRFSPSAYVIWLNKLKLNKILQK